MDFTKLVPTASEQKLVDAVARLIAPSAYDDRSLLKQVGEKYVVDVEATQMALKVNERNRVRAADVAMDVIRCVREHDK